MADHTAKLVVELTLNPETGAMQTTHHIAPESVEVLKSWPSGGLIHTSQALLVEALRRECYTMALTQMSLGRPLGSISAKELADLVQAHILKLGADLLGPLAVGTLDLLRQVPEPTAEGKSGPEGPRSG